MRGLAGKTAIVTGASRGIGLAIAQRLVDEVTRVVITARKPQPLEDAVAALGEPERALAVAGRSDDADHRAQTVALAVLTFGGVAFLVNNTGVNPAYGPWSTSTSTSRARSPRPTSWPRLPGRTPPGTPACATMVAPWSTSRRSPVCSLPRASGSTVCPRLR